MKEYEQHAIGKCYPPLSADARERLRANLHSIGPKSDVCIFENKILDGWHQYLICNEDSIPCQFAEVNPVDPIAFVVQRNEGRRHLTDDQRAMVAAQLAEIKRQRHGGIRQRKDQVSNSKLDLKKTTELVETAEQQHVSISKASRARRVMKVKPDAVEKIRNGELTISDVVGPLENKGRGKRGGTSAKTNPTANPGAKRPRTEVSSPFQTPEFKAMEAEALAKINAPSIYPEDADLPVHPSGAINTKFIQDSIIELRKNEPKIGKMPVREMFQRTIWPYTQAIQTYALNPRPSNALCGDIDPRLVEWARAVACKVRERQLLLFKRNELRKRNRGVKSQPQAKFKSNEKSNGKHKPKDSIESFLKELKKLLKQSHFALDDHKVVIQATQEVVTAYFEERWNAYAGKR